MVVCWCPFCGSPRIEVEDAGPATGFWACRGCLEVFRVEPLPDDEADPDDQLIYYPPGEEFPVTITRAEWEKIDNVRQSKGGAL